VVKLVVTTIVVTLSLVLALGIDAVSALWRHGGDATAMIHVAGSAGGVVLLALVTVLAGAVGRQRRGNHDLVVFTAHLQDDDEFNEATSGNQPRVPEGNDLKVSATYGPFHSAARIW
jgi:hypothetical protein